MNLAFQDPPPYKQLALRLSNLTRCYLSPRSTIKGSFSLQLGIDSLIYCRIYIVLGNQDVSAIISKACRRLWTRNIRNAVSWSVYCATRILVAK
uniref:Uncharacterized protein n=1 Tax=Peronospora matthiolae TaxID=2874970 RepID=A0AAV1V4Y7_9STRA